MARALECPTALRPGDRVRVVAPAGPAERDRLEAGLNWLREAQLEPVYDDGVFSRQGFLAGPDERRLREFQCAMADGDARAIWVARGGYGAARLLPELKTKAVQCHPKWLVGFSDVTALHALWRRAGLCSIYGANVSTIGDWSVAARKALLNCLFGGRTNTLKGRSGVGEGPVEGMVLGGNLRVLVALLGTPYFPDLTDCILLVEDVNEPPYKIDRLLVQLHQSGALQGVKGFAVGQLTGCEDRSGQPDAQGPEDVFRDHAARLERPMVFGLPVGHDSDSQAALLGVRATLNPGDASLRYA